jgi:hypothetical protein
MIHFEAIQITDPDDACQANSNNLVSFLESFIAESGANVDLQKTQTKHNHQACPFTYRHPKPNYLWDWHKEQGKITSQLDRKVGVVEGVHIDTGTFHQTRGIPGLMNRRALKEHNKSFCNCLCDNYCE